MLNEKGDKTDKTKITKYKSKGLDDSKPTEEINGQRFRVNGKRTSILIT